MKRWVVAAVLAVLSVLGMPAPAASADEADCAESRFTQGGYEVFDIDPKFLPPPMRGRAFDCAIRVGDRPFNEELQPDGGYFLSIQYILLYVDMTYDEMVDFYRAWESSGYAAGNEINVIDDGSGSQGVALGAEDLAAADPRPFFVNARFSNAQTVPPPSTPGSNIYEFTWTDGDVVEGASGIQDRPVLFASVILTEPFGSATGIADPSRLSTLRTIADVAPTPAQWGVIAGGSVMLMLVVGWPSALLNSVVGSRYQSIVRWVTTRFRRKPPLPRDPTSSPDPPPSPDAGAAPRRSRLPGWLMWPGFALAAVLGAFVDPTFGVNLMSLRLVVTLFLSFLLFNFAAWAVVRAVARRVQPDSDPYLRFRWGSLLLVALAVIVARLLELNPGVIFGLVAGIAYAVTLRASRSGAIVLVGSAFGLALALVGWVAYSLLAPVTADAGQNVVLVFLVEFLSGVTVKGISTLPLALLPLGNLDGAKVLGWKKWVWGVSYAVGLGAFMLVLLTIPKAWGEIPGDFVRWLGIFGIYALLAIVIWVVNARRLAKHPPPPESQQGDQPDAITID